MNLFWRLSTGYRSIDRMTMTLERSKVRVQWSKTRYRIGDITIRQSQSETLREERDEQGEDRDQERIGEVILQSEKHLHEGKAQGQVSTKTSLCWSISWGSARLWITWTRKLRVEHRSHRDEEVRELLLPDFAGPVQWRDATGTSRSSRRLSRNATRSSGWSSRSRKRKRGNADDDTLVPAQVIELTEKRHVLQQWSLKFNSTFSHKTLDKSVILWLERWRIDF